MQIRPQLPILVFLTCTPLALSSFDIPQGDSYNESTN
jgi:hypothetical protein